MPYTNVAKPSASSYTAVNTAKPSFDEPGLSYDDTATFYDGVNQTAYNNESKPSTLDQSQIDFGSFEDIGGTSTNGEMIAQSFQPTVTKGLDHVSIRFYRQNNPSDYIQMQLYSSSAGVPGSLLATADNVVPGEILATTPFEFNFFFRDTPVLTANTTYFFVVSRTGALNNTNNYRITVNNTTSYTRGSAFLYASGSWFITDPAESMYFKEYYTNYTNLAKPV